MAIPVAMKPQPTVEKKQQQEEDDTEEEVSEYDGWEVQAAIDRVCKEQFTTIHYVGHVGAAAAAGRGGGGDNPPPPPPGPKKIIPPTELVVPAKGRMLGGGSAARQLYLLVRLVVTVTFGLLVLLGIAIAYGANFSVASYDSGRIGLGLYGVVITAHMLVQSALAWMNHRVMEEKKPPTNFGSKAKSKVAIQISAHKEDPLYFRLCMESILCLNYPAKNLKVVCCVDGNSDEDVYMADIFEQVVRSFGKKPVVFWWDYNLHELPTAGGTETNGVDALRECIEANSHVCVLQKWGGKREVMYSAIKSLIGTDIDYVQVCDSDTRLHPNATMELVWILDNDAKTGAVGGDVRILNDGDSYLTFLTSIRYWIAFNIERAAQSYVGCVSCISGPLGLYRVSIVSEIVDLWSDQTFLGTLCTFGDDRHLTNRVLQVGAATRYTHRSYCLTETPAQYSRWLNQQIRWTKSFYREWLFNAMWWHKHSIWMMYESVVSGLLPFFIMATMLRAVYSGNLWVFMTVLLLIQFVGIVKGGIAALLKGDAVMFFLSLYSVLYVSSLLPAKLYALLTMTQTGWGTSGRLQILANNQSLIPPTVWITIILAGLFYTVVTNDYEKEGEVKYLLSGAAVYLVYWLVMYVAFKVWIEPNLHKKKHLEAITIKEGGLVDVTDVSKSNTTSDEESSGDFFGEEFGI